MSQAGGTAQHPSVETMRRAIGAYHTGMPREALALAEAASHMAVEIPGAPTEAALAHSWYGFLLGTVGRKPAEGLAICREAARKVSWEPRVYEHMARLELALGNRKAAVDLVEQGLKLAPGDGDLLTFRSSMGVRKPPPIRFLDRNHPLNKTLGKLRARNQKPAP